jgi:gamma-glutamyltranspeptidase
MHALYQAMSLAFADRDFYYGDPAFPPEEPVRGLLSKDYAKARYAQIDWSRNDPDVKPGDPYLFQGGKNPFQDLLSRWTVAPGPDASLPKAPAKSSRLAAPLSHAEFREQFTAGTTSIEAADEADRAAGVVRVDIRDWRWVEYISEAIYDEIDGNSSFKEIAEACLKAIADPHAEAVLAALTEAKP